jgi:hypothetical protein
VVGSVTMAKKRKDNHYIDNERFLQELIEHKKAVTKAKKDGVKPPGASEYIGQCFLDIANNLAKKPNFANYIFKEEMISDGIENCIMYTTNFDEKKSKNPFAFFTQIIYYAFLRRIQKEKKQLYVKMKCFENNDRSGKFRNRMIEDSKFTDENPRSENPYADFFSLSDTDVRNFEGGEVKKTAKKRRRKPTKKNLEDLME